MCDEPRCGCKRDAWALLALFVLPAALVAVLAVLAWVAGSAYGAAVLGLFEVVWVGYAWALVRDDWRGWPGRARRYVPPPPLPVVPRPAPVVPPSPPPFMEGVHGCRHRWSEVEAYEPRAAWRGLIEPEPYRECAACGVKVWGLAVVNPPVHGLL